MGSLPDIKRDNKYIVVKSGYFTQRVKAVAIPNIDAATAAILFEGWVCHYRSPGQLHSDRGRLFESGTMYDLFKLLQVHKTRTTEHCPEGNRRTEGKNQTFKRLFRAFV